MTTIKQLFWITVASAMTNEDIAASVSWALSGTGREFKPRKS